MTFDGPGLGRDERVLRLLGVQIEDGEALNLSGNTECEALRNVIFVRLIVRRSAYVRYS